MDIYPNPTRDVAHLDFRVTQAGPIRLSVFDTIGREVAVLEDGYKASGTYEFLLRKAGLATGIYFVRLRTTESIQTKKLILLR
jgi:hypothetical protein